MNPNTSKERLQTDYQRVSEEHKRLLQQATRWGTTMRDLGVGLVERPHRVFVMTPEPAIAKSDDEIVIPTSDLPTLPQIHQLTDKLRRTRTRLHELEIVLRTFN